MRVIEWLRRHVMVVLAVYVVALPALTAFTVASVVADHINKNHSAIVALQAQTLRTGLTAEQDQISNGCHRLNVLRGAQNQNNANVYEFFVYTAALLTFSALHPLEPAHSAAQAHSVRRGTLAFANRLKGFANQLTWTPLTNCILAQRQGLGYATPSPLTFAKHRFHAGI